jgi:hypothetical protein
VKRISLKNGQSWLYDGSLDTDERVVRFLDSTGQQQTVPRCDVVAVALDSGGAHPDDDEVVQLLST